MQKAVRRFQHLKVSLAGSSRIPMVRYCLLDLTLISILIGDEVEMIFAKEATEEQKRKARELMLPLNFFLYETAPPCPGCRGCEPEDSDEATAAKPASSSAAKPDTAAPKLEKTAFGNGSFMKAAAESSVSQLSFSALATTAASGFSKPASFSWSGAGKPVFGVSFPPSYCRNVLTYKKTNLSIDISGGSCYCCCPAGREIFQ